MRSSAQSILNAFFVLAVALALVPVAQASIYAMADGVNFNALARQKAQKRAQQLHYRDIVRNPFVLFKRQETDPGTPIPTPTDITPISNTSTTTTSAESTTADISSSLTTLEPTSSDDDLSTTTSTDAETTSPPETTTDGITTTPSSSTDLPSSTDVTTSEVSSTTTEDVTSTAETTSEETSATSSSDEPSETSTDVPTSTEVTTSTETTTTVRTTLNTSVKSAFTTAWSTSTFTLPNGSVGTVTEYLVVVPTMSPTPTRDSNPQESETATGTASLHTNGATLYTPGPAPVVAFMAVLGYIGGAAF
ncbi:hypothetical protein TWF730_004167 [Orbilia blumenaviensis]|uniref:Uncharacterized protein n=1 Tax=Orbilia blumenaviensis TaxID=1796055 RepID=A0AAV9U154_9PEZI